jgi:hypothetical protein
MRAATAGGLAPARQGVITSHLASPGQGGAGEGC